MDEVARHPQGTRMTSKLQNRCGRRREGTPRHWVIISDSLYAAGRRFHSYGSTRERKLYPRRCYWK